MDLPFVNFEDGDVSPARYKAESWMLMKQGYDQYIRRGQAFQMRNLADPSRPIVIMSMRYLEEVKTCPRTNSAFPSI